MLAYLKKLLLKMLCWWHCYHCDEISVADINQLIDQGSITFANYKNFVTQRSGHSSSTHVTIASLPLSAKLAVLLEPDSDLQALSIIYQQLQGCASFFAQKAPINLTPYADLRPQLSQLISNNRAIVAIYQKLASVREASTPATTVHHSEQSRALQPGDKIPRLLWALFNVNVISLLIDNTLTYADLLSLDENYLCLLENKTICQHLRDKHCLFADIKAGLIKITPAEGDKTITINWCISRQYMEQTIPNDIERIYRMIEPSFIDYLLKYHSDIGEHTDLSLLCNYHYRAMPYINQTTLLTGLTASACATLRASQSFALPRIV